MKPVMNLFRELGLHDAKIPYIMTTEHNVRYFNSQKRTNLEIDKMAEGGLFDPFRTSVQGLTGTVSHMVNKQIEHFRKKLLENFDEGWRELMTYDAWSTRGFMTLQGAPGVGKYSSEVRSIKHMWTPQNIECMRIRSSTTWKLWTRELEIITRPLVSRS